MFSYRTRCKEKESSKDIHRVHVGSRQCPVDETGKKVHGHESSCPLRGGNPQMMGGGKLIEDQKKT